MYNNKGCVSEGQDKYLKKIKRRKKLVSTSRVLILVLFLTIWELAADFGFIDAFIFSQPSRVLKSMIEMIKNGTLFYHIGITLFETIIGFLLGTGLGCLVAMLLWWNRFVSDVLEPYLVVLNSLPKTALAPIIIVWIGNNMNSIIVTALLTSVIVTILSVLSGFLSVDNDKIKLVETFGGTKSQILFKVVLPASVPAIISAIKISIGLSFVGVIVGEFLVAKAGLGYLIVYGSQIFKLDWVMMSVIILGIFAALLYKLIIIIESRLIKRWK
ncbi:MAG: ABC transporter permease [Lachnospiraceae bacterium]|nr:ABC transporter permease [Lachnospiraceae bacterium]